jgi:proteic killer suppression protein
VIQSFSDDTTEHLFHEGASWRFANLARPALRKLIQLNQAVVLADLAVPPGNRLEALRGNWAGHHSIRVNDQWRIVFRWTPAGPDKVALVDYH